MLSSNLDRIRAKFFASQNMSLLAGAFLLALLPFELEHLMLMLLGGGAYYALQKLQPRVAPATQKKTKVDLPPWRATRAQRSTSSTLPKERRSSSQSHGQPQCHGPPNNLGPLKKTLSAAPVAAPVFDSVDWEAEVTQLLGQMAPTRRCEKTVDHIASRVKRILQPVFPEAVVEVESFVCGNLEGGKAFGVAVPEVDIVVNVSPAAITQRMLSRDQLKAPKKVAGLDARALQKYAIRLCTERLVGPSTGLKFRRSAFRGDEPKVTFLAPAVPGFTEFETSVPFDLSLNSLTPFHNAALMTECGQLEPRAKALILLVRRWAKDRGICHASKGHFQPFVWTLLTIYFLQVGVDGNDTLLPPVEDFALSSDLVSGGGAPKEHKARVQNTTEKYSVGSLFNSFFRFYARFNWRTEAVAVKSGKRAAPASSLPLHVILHDDGSSELGPSIEDPFISGRNLGACMTSVSLGRLQEELTRADELCTNGASLSVLLQPWVPAEFEPEGNA